MLARVHRYSADIFPYGCAHLRYKKFASKSLASEGHWKLCSDNGAALSYAGLSHGTGYEQTSGQKTYEVIRSLVFFP